MKKDWWFWVSKACLEKKRKLYSESCTVFKKSAAEKNGDEKKCTYRARHNMT
jgi:hypothetical protein